MTTATTTDRSDVTYLQRSDLEHPTAFPARLEAVIGNMSVRAFARKAGVSDTFLRQCLAGRTEPTRTKLMAIAEAGDTTVEWLAVGGHPGPSAHVSVGEPAIEESGRVDRQLLESIVEAVEQVLSDAKTELISSRKAHLISALYDMHAGSDHGPISRESIHTLIADTA